MARARNADKAAESAQEAREAQGSSSAFQADDRSGGLSAAQDMPQDTQGAGALPGGAEDGQKRPDKEQLAECVLTEYAVTGCEALNLRAEPVLDAPIVAQLPRGAGVFEGAEPGPEGWLHVRTGRLEGWMMSKYLEALPLPELAYGAE